MYSVVYLTTLNNVLTVVPVGAFATYAAAEAWVAGQANPSQYQVVSAWSPVAPPGGSALSPATITVGAWVVALVGVTFSGTYAIYLYGPFATSALAQAYLATQFPPGGYSVCQIAALPA